MPGNSNKLTQFWQELKRRKVVRVITVYAAAAFVILELVSIIVDPLKLPEWTLPFIIVLLCVGFIIAVILSWIYDIHPEVGIVKTESIDTVKEVDIPKSSNSWKIASYISFVVIIGLVAFNIFGGNRGARINESLVKSIAVLPFHNFSGDSGQDYMCEGLTDEIISHLFKVKSFDQVRSLTSVLQYKDSDKSTTEIANALSVNYILEGSFKRIGDKLRITAQLIEPKNDNHIWLQDYDLPYQNVIGIPPEIALQIADHLKAFITEEEKQQIEKIPTDNLDAYENYMLGKSQMYRKEIDESLWKAVEYFQQAVSLDTTYALAYSGLAEVYYHMVNYSILSPKVAFLKAKAYALKALSMDDGLANSHCMLALIKGSFEYDFNGAEKEYKRALEIEPRSFEAHLYYARFLSTMGRHDEAISHITNATELDPFSTLAGVDRIVTLYYAGYKSEAIEAMEKFIDSYPNNSRGYWFCAVFYTDLKRYTEALSTVKLQISLMMDNNISDEVGLQGYLYGKMGQRDKALEQLDQLDFLSYKGYYIDPRTRVWVYLGIDEIDKAIEILRQSFEDHIFDPGFLKIYPSEFVQSDPGFIELQKNIGLIQ